MPKFLSFPENFLWGSSTSSYQVEGGNINNDWFAWEKDLKIPHKCGSAVDSYHRYEEDFDLSKALGHNAHRFSLEWSRIEPEEGRFDEREIEHYREVILALRRRGIEPVVTLHHFTNPLWFYRKGCWLNGSSSRESTW